MRFPRQVTGLAIFLALAPPNIFAHEADVHFGLTRWLALKAGFDASQADAIAVADQRVDGGLMDTIELALENSCVEHHVDASAHVQQRHAPSAVKAPAEPGARDVVPGSAASRERLVIVMKEAIGKEGLMLGKLGEAIHTLQDSWSHRGTPGVPMPGAGIACDPTLGSGLSTSRGGPDSHRANHTYRWPADVTEMARATYDALLAYPAIQSQKRKPSNWDTLNAPVQRFSIAKTKTEKRNWFVAEGVSDTNFLEGISLPDGPNPGPLHWSGRQLPPLGETTAIQHNVPADMRAFFDRLVLSWSRSRSMRTVVKEFGASSTPAMDRQLAARLALWKVRDHGAVAELAHAHGSLTTAQLAAVDRIVKDPRASLQPGSLTDTFFPLQAKGPYASPLLPYIVRTLPSADSGAARAIAIARPRHLPYDSIGWVAQKQGERWVLVDIVGIVDQ